MSERDLHSDDEVQDPGMSEEREMDVEAPEADAVEQHTPVRGTDNGAVDAVPLETDEADVADQRRTVELDEDDYR